MNMARKLVLAGVSLMGVGLLFLSLNNPLLRSALSGLAHSYGNQLHSGFASVSVPDLLAGRLNVTGVFELLVGFGLAGVSVVAEALSAFRNPTMTGQLTALRAVGE